MAAVARRLPVLATKRELGVSVVIEARRSPRVGRVTRAAVRPEAPEMDVVHAVAALAIGRGPFETIAGVAKAAGYVAVLSA
jgi:hypothetical protein